VWSFGAAAPASMLVHALALSLLLLAPLWRTPPPPRLERDYLGVLLYDPPPPPPLPQSFGRDQVSQRTTTRSLPQRPTPAVAAIVPEATLLEPAATLEPEPATESAGSPSGSVTGVLEGMDDGRLDGVVGGVPHGVRDGIVSGTGTVPVPAARFDRAPRLLRMVEPVYPPEAFAKKIEGVVSVEILVDAGGRVARTRITQSVPLLDAAALDAVRQWVFSPAMKDGRAVATLATAPVTFRIY
jgi:protein TonB